MKPAPFTYHAPATREEALALLAEDEDARPLAGGQSLMPMLAMRVLAPGALVDLNGVSDLAGIEWRDGALLVGAMARQRALERSAPVAAACPLLGDALRHVGHRQTRNRGTFGGSLAHLDPSAELPAVALALDATVHLQSARGRRDVPMSAFPRELLTPDLEAGELVTGVTLPLWREGHGHAFEEFARRRGDFAVVAVAALIEAREDGVVSRAAVAVAGAGPIPVRCAGAESCLTGSRGHAAVGDAAAACARVEAMSDLHASAGYRQHLARTLARRALDKAVRRAGAGGDP